MIVYALKHLKKQFGDKCVLDIDSLEIEQGYIYALLGPNGSGKTTLLNIMGFLDSPSQGHLAFKGKPVTFNAKTLQQLRKTVGVVSQNPILFTTSVFKNLEFGLKIRRFSKIQRRKIIEESLDLVGLRHLEQAPAHKLSGGETQRVVLARALALAPEVILCDEPTASVDLENQIKISQLLKEINQEKGITLVFTSHDKRQASSLPHYRLFLEQGKTSTYSNENTFLWPLISKESRLLQVIRESLPGDSSEVAGGRLRIDPYAIRLCDYSKTSGQSGIVPGKVVRVREDGEAIRLIVECGIRLNIRISMAEYQQLRPLVGDQVGVSIPAQAVSLQP